MQVCELKRGAGILVATLGGLLDLLDRRSLSVLHARQNTQNRKIPNHRTLPWKCTTMAAGKAGFITLLLLVGARALCGDTRPVALLLRIAGTVRPARYEVMRSYASSTDGIGDFWIQYDRSCPEQSHVDRATKCVRIATAAVAELRGFELDVRNVQLHVTSTVQVLRGFPALSGNWTSGEKFHSWGGLLGRTQHELFVLAWWREVRGATRYNAVWVAEDDVRYGGDVGAFLARHEKVHGPCGTDGAADYVGSQFMPTYEATGSDFLRNRWLHWKKREKVSAEFARAIPVARWVRKVEYIEKYGERVLQVLDAALQRGSFAFGEFFASSLCAAAQPANCFMLDIACCPPTATHEFLRHCTHMGLPLAVPKAQVRDCVALGTRHWIDRIKQEDWEGRRYNESQRWYHPLKW